jgi:lactoylglutathione lyase
MFQKILATELLVRDLATCAAFYRETLRLSVTESEPDHVTFKVGDLYLFVHDASSAARMMSAAPLEVASEGGSHVLLAASVDDVDALYAYLKAKGVKLLRPPADQPWGLRTAYFADPEDNYWEINQPISSQPASQAEG